MVLAIAAGPASARWEETGSLKNSLHQPFAACMEQVRAQIESRQGEYHVVPGDTLFSIAQNHGLAVPQLAAINELADQDQIYAGQILRLPGEIIRHKIDQGETLLEISSKYKVGLDTIVSCNHIIDENQVLAGEQIIIPVLAKNTVPRTPARVKAPENLALEQLAEQLPWPVAGWISSPFGMRDGRMHQGIDIAADSGEPITAVRGGEVTFAGAQDGYGLTVIIDHGQGLSTLYAHCSELLVEAGDRVAPGCLIARVGSTGRSTGPHLHLEVQLNGIPHDPLPCLQKVYA